VLSDFITTGYEEALRVAAKRHDIIGFMLYDRHEKALPDAGLLSVQDRETGETMLLDTGHARLRDVYQQRFTERLQEYRQTFARSNADTIHLQSDASYITALHLFFKKRAG
jgi:hypothetical protein